MPRTPIGSSNTLAHTPVHDERLYQKEESVLCNEDDVGEVRILLYQGAGEYEYDVTDTISNEANTTHKAAEHCTDITQDKKREGKNCGLLNLLKCSCVDTHIAAMHYGTTFIKYGRRGRPHKRFVWLSENCTELFWHVCRYHSNNTYIYKYFRRTKIRKGAVLAVPRLCVL